MTKRKSNSNSKATNGKPVPKGKSARSANASKPNDDSKQSAVIRMLSRSEGTTIPVIVKTTGWQQHSVRGFFAGVVRKKLGLKLVSEKKENSDRIYRIVAGADSTSRPASTKRATARKANKNSQSAASSQAH